MLFRSSFGQPKTYVALVFGWPKENEAVWRDRIEVSKERGKARGRVGSGVWAEARMKVRERLQGKQGPMALVELRPTTGRTHQLRIQCANRGIPIVGDRIYGDFQKNRLVMTDFLFLHSESIEILIIESKIKAYLATPEYFMHIK